MFSSNVTRSGQRKLFQLSVKMMTLGGDDRAAGQGQGDAEEDMEQAGPVDDSGFFELARECQEELPEDVDAEARSRSGRISA